MHFTYSIEETKELSLSLYSDSMGVNIGKRPSLRADKSKLLRWSGKRHTTTTKPTIARVIFNTTGRCETPLVLMSVAVVAVFLDVHKYPIHHDYCILYSNIA